MSIARMKKIMIVSHKNEASQLLESLQDIGAVQVLDAERAMVTKEWPELAAQGVKSRDLEDMLLKITQGLDFLEKNATGKPLTSMFQPRVVVGKDDYLKTAASNKAIELLDEAEELRLKMDKCLSDIENLQGRLNALNPWISLASPLEELYQLETSTVFTGLIPERNFESTISLVEQANGIYEKISHQGDNFAVMVIALKEEAIEVAKILRANEFDSVSLESFAGTVQENVAQVSDQLEELRLQLDDMKNTAQELSKRRVELKILFDHITNKLARENTHNSVPATEHTVMYEGWVRKSDLGVIEKVVAKYPASCFSEIDPAEDEDVPVEIENKGPVWPFEVITRLYGMPKYVELDPTVLLAPFFALFFALCLTDAGYGIILVGICYFILKKMQASSRLLWMLLLCSALTIVAGALTGGWFGAGLEEFAKAKNITWLAESIDKMRLFDPLSNPMPFLKLSILLGYIQIMVGLFAGFIHNFMRKSYIAGLCDHFSWILIINSIVVIAFADKVPPVAVNICKILIPIGAVLIVSGSHREGGLGARIGMGLYNLTGAIFYVGDILSYLRLMALGLGTAGVAIAVNIIAKLVAGIPYVGFILAVFILIAGHLFNIAMSALGAFIHSLRLQFVEFFPKFMEGGGTEFQPLTKEYQHVYVESE